MMCFKDMTFCNAYPTRCANGKCHRALTSKLRVEADQWWGKDGAPIARSDFSRDCKDMVPA